MAEWLDLYTGLNDCTMCQLCYAACPVARTPGYARAPLLSTLIAAFGSRWDLDTVAETISYCVDCRACQTICPYDVPIPAAMEWIRGELARRGQLTPAQAASLDRILRTADNAALSSSKSLPRACRGGSEIRNPKSEILYHAGEATQRLRPALARAFETIMARAGQTFQVYSELDASCGAALLRWGRAGEVVPLARAHAAELRRRGVRTIVTSAPACYRALAVDYPRLVPDWDFEVLHTAEYLLRLLEEGALALRSVYARRLAYHDPCYLGRYLGVYEAPRRLITACSGTGWIELEPSHAEAPCCGAGEGLGYVHEETFRPLAGGRLREAAEKGAEVLVTASPSCADFFQRAEGLAVLDVIELVEYCVLREQYTVELRRHS